MKIIDSNKDFYDFYQNIYRDDTFTFDRRDSYNFSKKEFADNFYERRSWRYKNDGKDEFALTHYVLLQVCNSFWAFRLFITKKSEFGLCLDYDLSLLEKWKDYSKPSKCIELSSIDFAGYSFSRFINDDRSVQQKIKDGDVKVVKKFNNFSYSKGDPGNRVVKHIPILKNIGIASLVDPLEIYLALEEYFSKLKTDSERTESIGLTNDEKIENHGFDLKTSFRGKNK